MMWNEVTVVLEIGKIFLPCSKYEDIIIRLALAFFFGGIIGLNRGVKRRGAGIKTHVLVCMSSALVMMTGEYIYENYGGTGDIARLGAQVISGVGFLGVGTIMVTGRNQIKGLTTAATLWTSACMGLTIGIGFYEAAVIMEFLVMMNLVVVTKIDHYIVSHSRIIDLYIEFRNIKAVSEFVNAMRINKINFQFSEMNKVHIKGAGVAAMSTIKLKKRDDQDFIMDTIRSVEGVQFVEKL